MTTNVPRPAQAAPADGAAPPGEMLFSRAVDTVEPVGDMAQPRDVAALARAPERTPLPDLAPALRSKVATLAERLAAQNEGANVSTQRTATGERQTEIELAPAELGKLKITLQTNERGLALQIVAERPETLDVVRRQLEGLHRALLSDGVKLDALEMGSMGARTGQGAAHQAQAEPQRPAMAEPGQDGDAETEHPPSDQAPPLTANGRLDIRI
ncbi:MAG: flagellar hook-length control protein FliK [Pseudomonadota bacterium]